MKKLGHKAIMKIANDLRAECNKLTNEERAALHERTMEIMKDINDGKTISFKRNPKSISKV